MSRKFFFVALVSGVLFGAACSDIPEGGRCDTNNGSDDCESGLICTPSAQLTSNPGESAQQQGTQSQTLGLCCPPQGSPVINATACYRNTGTTGTGGSQGTGGGASGTPGSGGSAGVDGSAGAAGSGGSAGSAGTAGTAGTAGSAGAAGSAGSAGAAGSAGSDSGTPKDAGKG